MKSIKRIANGIKDELNGAMDYAEKYIEHKANNSKWATKYRELAEQELQHAITLHEIALEEINKLSEVFTPSPEMVEKWEDTHNEYIEKTSRVKYILSL